jgi:ArsR family transcriptional regulator
MKNDKYRQEAATLFAALGAVSRLHILQLLSKNSLCVGALSRLTGLSAGAVSQHLRVLRSAGLVVGERRGYFIHYHLAPNARRRLTSALAQLLKRPGGGKKCVVKG